MELKDVGLTQVGVAKDKGIENMEQLGKILTDADRQAGENATMKKQIAQMEKEAEERELEPDPTPEPEAAAPGTPPSEWGLGTSQGQANQDFQQHLLTDPMAAVGNVARHWVAADTKDLRAENQKLSDRIADLETLDNLSEQIEDTTLLMGDDFMEKHKDDLAKFMKKNEGKGLEKNALSHHFLKIEKQEKNEGVDDVSIAEELGERKGSGATAEGESDGGTGAGGGIMEGMSREEMEKHLKIGDDSQPIREGD